MGVDTGGTCAGGGVWLGWKEGKHTKKTGMCIGRLRCAGKVQKDNSSVLTDVCICLCIMGVGKGGRGRPPAPPPPLESGEVFQCSI